MREIRKSKDEQSCAIKRDLPDDHPELWGIMTIANGGHYGSQSEVEDWDIVK